MKTFCTLSDIRYKLLGLALLNSLKTHCKEDFELYYLCLDDEMYQLLVKQSFKNVIPIRVTDLENENADLMEFKERQQPEIGGTNNAGYCWALASYFSHYLLKNKAKEVMYIDSDIYFYADPQIIYDEVGDKSVGIIKQRHNLVGSIDGGYNVGIVLFSGDVGLQVADWWKDGVINNKYPEYATCYDQKYLEGFIPEFGEDNICIIDKTVGHGAPWNYRLYVYDELDSTGNIMYGNIEQTFVFNHFSRMKYESGLQEPRAIQDFCGGNYIDHTLGFQVFHMPQVRKLYRDYYSVLSTIERHLQNG
jgi:hypothetical protein